MRVRSWGPARLYVTPRCVGMGSCGRSPVLVLVVVLVLLLILLLLVLVFVLPGGSRRLGRDPPAATHPDPARPTKRDPPGATHPARPTHFHGYPWMEIEAWISMH